jgi:hypothetical protein
MAVDIILAKNGSPIKNRSIIINSKTIKNSSLVYSTYDAFVTNVPTITDIENKYDYRFNHPSYYYGGGSGGDVDGGNVGDVVVGG